jgi:hypothetical protein
VEKFTGGMDLDTSSLVDQAEEAKTIFFEVKHLNLFDLFTLKLYDFLQL